MATQKKQVLIRVQPDTYEKLKIISDKNHRSVSNQMEWLMLQFITDYEEEPGSKRVYMLYPEDGSASDDVSYGYGYEDEPETSLEVSYEPDTTVVSRRSRPQSSAGGLFF